MVHGIHKGGRVGGQILPNHRVTVLQQCGQCRRAGRMKGRLIRAQTTGSKTISCTGQLVLCAAVTTPAVSMMRIVYPRETPPHTRTARAQPSAAHRRLPPPPPQTSVTQSYSAQIPLTRSVDLAFTRYCHHRLYGVWHKKGRSVGGRMLRNGRAIVLQ